MIQLNFSIDLKYEIADQASDFIFNIHAAHTPQQKVVNESLSITPHLIPSVYSDPVSDTRFMRFRAGPGPLAVRYIATVNIDHHLESPALIKEVPIAQLPPSVLPYLYPSRYCQADRLRRFATCEFGHLQQGYGRVQAIQDWVRLRTTFKAGSSGVNTSALDTLTEQIGVCRDFAHLMIALCRAVNIPARYVTGIDYGADPALGLPDFHAYVEVFVGDRWYLFDPAGVSPPMGLVRIGTGRDAADVSFATVFGTVSLPVPLIHIEAVENRDTGSVLPRLCAEAVSSMALA